MNWLIFGLLNKDGVIVLEIFFVFIEFVLYVFKFFGYNFLVFVRDIEIKFWGLVFEKGFLLFWSLRVVVSIYWVFVILKFLWGRWGDILFRNLR